MLIDYAALLRRYAITETNAATLHFSLRHLFRRYALSIQTRTTHDHTMLRVISLL